MSSYEPKTDGKVLLKTSGGDVLIELWPRAAPKACRNFLQLCLEGYYDDCVFHRILRNKLIQGGDPSGTGFGGESIFGKPFSDEFHSKLKFSYRGIVAMANSGAPNTNGSQFFITLAECAWLNKKHTIFGKVVGKSFFSVLEMANSEVGEDDRPLFAPKIISAQIIQNPFSDIIPRKKTKTVEVNPGNKVVKKALKSKPKPNLLSFGVHGDDSSDSEEIFKTKKFSSAHEAFKGKRQPTPLSPVGKYEAKQPVKEAPTGKKALKAISKSAQGEEKQPKTASNASRISKEYKKLKNELIRKKKEVELKNFGIIEPGDRKKSSTKPLSLLQKRILKYKKPKIDNSEEREEKIMRGLRKFSKSLHRMAESYSKKPPKHESSEESEAEEYWYRDGMLRFSKMPSRLNDFKLEDYEIIDEKAEKKD